MPSVSSAQHNLFEWARSNPKAAKKRGISPKVAEDFVQADKKKAAKLPKGKKSKIWEKMYKSHD